MCQYVRLVAMRRAAAPCPPSPGLLPRLHRRRACGAQPEVSVNARCPKTPRQPRILLSSYRYDQHSALEDFGLNHLFIHQDLRWMANVTTFKHAEGVEEILVQRSLPFPSSREGIVFGLALILIFCSIFLGNLFVNIGAVGMIMWSFQLLRSVKEESVLLCTDLGIQLTRRPFVGSAQSVFVEHHKVEDVILNEGITFASVQTYLAFIIRASSVPYPVASNSKIADVASVAGQ